MEKEKNCLLCKNGFEHSSATYCNNCGAPHHYDCWNYIQHCADFHCGCTQKTSTPSSVSSRTERGELEEPLSKEAEYLRLDINSKLEIILMYITGFLLVVAVFASISTDKAVQWDILRIVLPLAFAVILFRMFVDCTYVIDSTNKVLLFRKTILGVSSSSIICKFEDIKAVGLWVFTGGAGGSVGVASDRDGEFKSIGRCEVVLELNSGACFSVSKTDNIGSLATGLAYSISKFVDADFLPPLEGKTTIRPNNPTLPMKPAQSTNFPTTLWGYPGGVDYFMLIVSITGNIWVFWR